MRDKTRKILADLVDFSSKIRRYRFYEKVKDLGFRFQITLDGDGDTDGVINFILPDEKERDATILTFRAFDQQNENFSFHKLNKLAEDDQLSESFRNDLLRIRQTYFDYLNGCPQGIKPGFFESGSNPSRGEIMRVVINGKLAHRRDREKSRKFDTWSRDPVRESVLFQAFSRIVCDVIQLIYQLADATKRELNFHNSPSAG